MKTICIILKKKNLLTELHFRVLFTLSFFIRKLFSLLVTDYILTI